VNVIQGRTLAATLGVWLVAVACGGGASPASPPEEASPSAPTPVGTLTVTDSGCTIEGVDGPIAPGRITFLAANETDRAAAFNIAAIEEGHSFDELVSHIDQEIGLAEAGDPALGHPSFAVPLFDVLLDAGGSGTLSGTISDPGTYGLTCARVYDEAGELRPAGALGPVEVG
jgi:hypothetical protein